MITTVSSIAGIGLPAGISIAPVVFLILILVVKELTSARSSRFYRISSNVLNVSIVPMLMVFGAILVTKIIEIVI